MKHLTALLLLMILTFPAVAQNPSVRGSVTDQAGTGLANASVMLVHLPDSSVSGTISGKSGSFVIEDVKKGRYLFVVKYLGFKSDTTRLTISTKDVNVGKIKLQEDDVEMKAVEVTGVYSPAVVKGDTSEFNARSFKVNPDASAEDLVTKVPGVTMESGKVKAHGEEVKQVLVDGRTFFGSDPTAALRSVPAELIDKVQVYDQLSEQSRMTGFDDGNTQKTINLITRQNMRNGIFGKFYGGGGKDDFGSDANNEYKIGTATNILHGDMRLTVLAQSNNVNEQNFAIEDILGSSSGGGGGNAFRMMAGSMGAGASRMAFSMGGGGGPMGTFLVTPSGGISRTNAVGLNYSDKWSDALEVSGSYFFNRSNNDAETDLQRQYIISQLTGSGSSMNLAGLSQYYTQKENSSTINTNHRFNMRLEWNPDTLNSLIVRPRFTAQQNNGSSVISGASQIGGADINKSDSRRVTDLTGTNFSSDFMYRHRFETRGRSFMVGFSTGYNTYNGSADLLSTYSSFSNSLWSIDSTNQSADLDKKGWSLSANASYTEPISSVSMLQLSYNASKTNDQSDKTTDVFNPLTGSYDILDTALTNRYTNILFTHSVEGNYRYQYDNLQFSLGVAYQIANLSGDQQYPQLVNLDRKFYNILPNAQARLRISRDKNLFINYRARTSSPSIDKLQNVLDNTNPLQLSIGNPSLKQDFSHNLNLRYMSSNFGAGTYFFTFLGGSYTNDAIVNNTLIATSDTVVDGISVLRGAQLIRPVNVDGSASVRALATYGFPFAFIGSNVNLSAFANLSRTPGMINGQKNFSNTPTIGAMVTIASNISQDFDFTISSFSTQSFVRNTLRTDLNTQYFMQNTRIKLNWIFLGGLVFTSDVTHTYSSGLSSSYNQNTVMWNLGLGYKFLPNNAAELKLTVFDVLKQNQNISRTSTESYIEDNRSNILQRYALLTFTYTLRSFWAGNAAEDDHHHGPPGMGGPPPGGPGGPGGPGF